MNLSETEPYQSILTDLQWLETNVKLDPPLFAEDFLRDIANELAVLVRKVSDGEV